MNKTAVCCGLNRTQHYMSKYHRFFSRNGGECPLLAPFVRRKKKLELMKIKKDDRDQAASAFVSDDVIPLRARMSFSLRKENINKFA